MEIDKERVAWVEYDLFSPYTHIRARTFLRRGGISNGHYFSLNASDHVGDHPDAVKFNHELIKKQMEVEFLVFAKQVHGTNIAVIDKNNVKKAVEADILVTTDKKIGLGITHADCQAALFYDPKHEVIAAAHVGWKGLFLGVYPILLQFLKDQYTTNPAELIVGISPSLCPNHAELKNYKEDVPKKYWDFKNNKDYFDLWAITKKQLMEFGMLENNIEFANECTFENEKDYFSYRREKLKAKDRETGRNASVIAILK